MLQRSLLGLSRRAKIALMAATDAALLALAVWLGLSLRYGFVWWPEDKDQVLAVMAAVGSGVAALGVLGLYRSMVRYVSADTVTVILKALAVSALILGTAMLFLRATLPRSTPLLYWLVSAFLVIGIRFMAQGYLHRAGLRQRSPVIIYGAGAAGVELALSLRQSRDYLPVAFVDDKPGLQGLLVYGLKVHAPARLDWLIEEFGVEQVFLAMPSLSNSRRREILLFLERFSLKVKTVPRLADILDGRARAEDIKDIDLEDLLGRDPVPPDPRLLASMIAGKRVMVTGAGGSIGSELCRKIVTLGPELLVMFEQSEYALYAIEQELNTMLRHHPALAGVRLVPVLGSVQNAGRLDSVFREYPGIATVFHAAAYKHVPLVEHNVVEGVSNNVFGTWTAALAAREAGVRTFVLISTDKAVRPTNVMGASKRMAELALQALAEEEALKPDGQRTCFCMVRFGNVLGSSGSVVPLFKEQIRRGGPVTVTHPDVIRYFMTIPEAAQLVIQAGAMASGGDVFLLDMGEPVRIADLARRMIHLMGYHVRQGGDAGGIAIEFTGLRPGEKLFEELLVGEQDEATSHPRIRRACEHFLSWGDLGPALQRLESASRQNDVDSIKAVLRSLPIGYVEPGARRSGDPVRE